jgi:hypothetical protein
MTILPWGNFKDQDISDCPSSYLLWLAENCHWDDNICEEADEEWQYREKYNEHVEDD